MAHVVFLRAVNVGGRTLRPKAVADEVGLVNVGAAGTFVSLDGRAPRVLEREIHRRLPFETHVMIRPAAELLRLSRDPFADDAPPDATKRFVSVLAAAPAVRPRPPLPIERPEGGKWEVRVLRLVGPYALSHWRRQRAGRLLYPNEVVEKALGVPATTRGWETLLTICRILERAP